MSRSPLASVRCAVGHIHPVDKSLLLFMLILLLQSAANMILPGESSQLAGEIDVIVRTSAAAIFGYFLSGNFIRSTSGQSPLPQTPHILETGASDADSGALKARIGFTPEDSAVPSGGSAVQPSASGSSNGCLQISIAAAIGLFCLITLLALRNCIQLGILPEEAGSTAAVTQFRDFVSGCVGFLIGSPTHTSQSAS